MQHSFQKGGGQGGVFNQTATLPQKIWLRIIFNHDKVRKVLTDLPISMLQEVCYCDKLRNLSSKLLMKFSPHSLIIAGNTKT